ncbi:MAG: YidC/Oxa1 family membrane protein insertase [Candidatus Margulisiibacteriota bacterium]
MEFLSNIMVDALRFFAIFGGYGWGIIWLTIAVNLALYPLTLSSVKSMSAMQRLQPKLQEVQKKHKDKPQELQKATMDLYRSEGVNPIGGCLPVLLKIPFFLALFWAFQSTAFMEIASDPSNNTRFLWIGERVAAHAFHSEDLAKRLEESKVIILDKKASQKAGENRYVWNLVLPVKEGKLNDVLRSIKKADDEEKERLMTELSGTVKGLGEEDTGRIISAWKSTSSLAKPSRLPQPFGQISLLALLIGITTFLMQKSMPGGGTQQAQMMTMFMPAFIVFICWNFPAGVQLYWLVSNAVGAAQQYFIMKKPGHPTRKKGAKK